MKRIAVCLSVFSLMALCRASADYSVFGEGAWPDSWPKELEPLRKQAGTIQGSLADLVTHHIPFTDREQFEAAWPHLLKVKSQGAPVILLKSPAKHWHFGETKAGVLIHTPSPDSKDPELPVPGPRDVRSKWIKTTYIELVVDGQIVDLNRIPLPAETPIVDERFKEDRGK
jgi:hypothetical protein